MKEILKITGKLSVFLWLSVAFFIICFIILLNYSQFHIHLVINSFNNYFLDTFFKYFTHVGDGVFIILLSILLLFYRKGYSFLIVSSYAITSLIIQFIKRGLFYGSPRPLRFFEFSYYLHYVEGVEMADINSFPSGHSATAFTLFICLAALTKNKMWQFMYFLLAILVAYSRMYLSQHFLIDVYAGSMIGLFMGFLCVTYYLSHPKSWYEKPIHQKK